mgnify:FL=1
MRYIERKVKLPDWLWEWLEDVARANEETVDDTIAWLLTQHYNVYEKTVLVPSIRKKKTEGGGGS